MCTLTYLPNTDGFTLTHNRDERASRPATQDFVEKRVGDKELYFPQDLEANGSWFVHNKDQTLCILNGGYKDYEPLKKYRQSRGLIPLYYFDFKDIESFHQNYNFSGIEPFTLIIAGKQKLNKLVHDFDETVLEALDPNTTHIWSSTKLYAPEIRKQRAKWFDAWLQETKTYSSEAIRQFHLHAGDGDKSTNLRMSRWGIVETVSLTQAHTNATSDQLYYHNFTYPDFAVKQIRKA
jgi:uncharacterized protein with NRDE domain